MMNKTTTTLTGLLGGAALALSACSANDSTTTDTPKAKTEMASADGPLCLASGPQTPRDISNRSGLNDVMFGMAPASTQMNLCNIHTHTNAEHKGPGFEMFVNDSDYGGYACNATADLTDAELAPYDSRYGKLNPATRLRSTGFTHPATQPRAKALVPVCQRPVRTLFCGLKRKSSCWSMIAMQLISRITPIWVIK
jgi:hypothetical protein